MAGGAIGKPTRRLNPNKDIDGDGDVDSADLALLLGDWGACPGCPEDLNGDGTVNSFDLALLLGAWS